MKYLIYLDLKKILRNRIVYLLPIVLVSFLQKISSQCTCLEQKEELSRPNLRLCENFEAYVQGSPFPNGNTSWSLWPSSTFKGSVKNAPGELNKTLFIQKTSTNTPDLLLKLGNKTSGRFRISWQVYVPKGKKAYYNFQHEENVVNGHWAFEVNFSETGIGYLQLGRDTVSRFPFFFETWNKVMHIIDLDNNEIELWINNEFIDAWKFNLGTNGGAALLSNKLGAVNFYAPDNAEYYLDNICVWERGLYSPIATIELVCLKNGRTVKNSYLARNQFLYTSNEFSKEKCPDICDFSGLNVKESLYPQVTFHTPQFPQTSIDSKSVLPNTVINHECLKDVFPELSRKQLRGQIYPYKNNEATESYPFIKIEIDSLSISNLSVVVIECGSFGKCIVPIDYTRRSEIELAFLAEPQKEYIIIILAKKNLQFGIDIKPSLLIFDCVPNCSCLNIKKGFDGQSRLQNQKTGEISIVEKLFLEAPKAYLGGEITYLVKVENPGLVNFYLEAKGDGYVMYLAGDKCNENLLALSATNTNGTASITKHLEAGIYNLSIDQLTLNPNSTFNLSYTITPIAASAQSNQPDCPTLNNQAHNIIIRGAPLLLNGDPLTIQDRIYLTNNRNKNNREANAFNWNGNELKFTLYSDNPADNNACGYLDNETIEFTIIRGNKVYAVTPIYQPENGKEITGRDKFKKGAQSLIIGFVANLNVSNLGVNSLPELTAAAKTFFAEINCNTSWKLERKNTNSENWLKFEPRSGQGIKDVKFSVDPNSFTRSRSDTLYLINPEGFYKTIIINQPGCTGPTVNAGLDQIYCPNQNFTLTATGSGIITWQTPGTASRTRITTSITSTQTFTAFSTLNGCTAFDQVVVKVHNNPAVSVVASRLVIGPSGFIDVNVIGGTPNYNYQWFRNDTLISRQQDLIEPKKGIHKLIVTDANGCSVVYGPVSISGTTASLDLAVIKELNIYPNPTQGQLRIEGKLSKKETVQVRILEATGKYIWKSDIKTANEFLYTPDLSNLAPGIYIIQLDVSGDLVYRKLIVQ